MKITKVEKVPIDNGRTLTHEEYATVEDSKGNLSKIGATSLVSRDKLISNLATRVTMAGEQIEAHNQQLRQLMQIVATLLKEDING